MHKIFSIRSGGQSGVDRAALDFALQHSIQVRGWCPHGGWAEDLSEVPGLLEKYPMLQETPSVEPSQRTIWNVRDSHATLIYLPAYSHLSEGTSLTEETAKAMGRPVFVIYSEKDIEDAKKWLDSLGVEITLNIGGPRESECPGIYNETLRILASILL